MENIMKRLGELHDEVDDVCAVEKKEGRTEFMTGIMAAHQHRVSLFVRKGKLVGKTERVNGHVHKVDVAAVEKDLLGFTQPEDNHKHRIQFRIKDPAKK